MEESGLSKKFWAECLAALINVLNHCPTSAVEGKTPHEVWYKEKLCVGHLRVWRYLTYIHIQKDKRAKLGLHMESLLDILMVTRVGSSIIQKLIKSLSVNVQILMKGTLIKDNS